MHLLLLLSACATTAPPAPERPAAPVAAAAPAAPAEPAFEVFVESADGAPVLGRAQVEACRWLVAARDGDGWGPPVPVPGYPLAAVSPSGAVALWTRCEGEAIDTFRVAPSLADLAPARSPADLSAQLPEFVEQAWWTSPGALTVQGRALGDRVAGAWAFSLGPDGVTAAPDPCIDQTLAADGTARRAGTTLAVLLQDDLDDDDLDEVVLEEPDSCGTARCDATVWTRCPAADRWRRVGELDHRDGVAALPDTDRGWKRLRSTHADGADIWAFDGRTYRRAR